jgi:hypothetical protein
VMRSGWVRRLGAHVQIDQQRGRVDPLNPHTLNPGHRGLCLVVHRGRLTGAGGARLRGGREGHPRYGRLHRAVRVGLFGLAVGEILPNQTSALALVLLSPSVIEGALHPARDPRGRRRHRQGGEVPAVRRRFHPRPAGARLRAARQTRRLTATPRGDDPARRALRRSRMRHRTRRTRCVGGDRRGACCRVERRALTKLRSAVGDAYDPALTRFADDEKDYG